jgi:hypothetical protein
MKHSLGLCAAGGLAAMVVLAAGVSRAVETDWVVLFDGKSLNGWSQKNGTATYRVEDETIVGRTSEGRPNSFLCTDKEYGDFELEFEVKVADQLNSGVQIRSQTVGGTADGRVNGPQVEIEASPGFSGYIYGEGTPRGWISPDESRKRHSHLKNGEWNRYRVVAKGPRIQTWINGEAVADISDDESHKTYSKGFIGLQVHGIAAGAGPFEVAWRNIRIRELGS